ncbi:unnamed protein product [Arabidopsis arenosa]|uniref:BLOC-1-related complex subunit 6 C-terminal helix domain-containing protein n=1 Tax=Arabidopsis arenosa TaxID=38785 RepID=A0A8S2AWM5_ARAAE|nr:unnamed protein product [Arabidopsis arenosa]
MDAGAEIDVVQPVENDSAAETGPTQDHGGRSEPSSLNQGEILRTLATVEKDSQAIAESFSSLFVSLRSTLSEATGSSVDHMTCFGDAAGRLQENALDAATKGNRYINSCLRLNEEIKGVENLAARLKHLRKNVDVLDTASLLDRISKIGGKLSPAPTLPEVQLSQYVPSLEKIATLKLLQQVSALMFLTWYNNNYESSSVGPFFDFSTDETISADAVRNNFVDMKVDHIKGVVIFGNLSNESDGLKEPLAIFAETMNKVRSMLFPAPSKASKVGDVVPNLEETVEKEHKRLLTRNSIIEKRKEEQGRQQLEMELEEKQRKLKLLKLTNETEQKRLAIELKERRRHRILRGIEEKVTKQTVMEKAMSEKRKEDQEMEMKLQKLAKTMDYLERAKREEASPMIEAAYQQRLVEERNFYEHGQQNEVELSKERLKSDLKEKKRLARMLDNKEIFQDRVSSLQQAEFERIRKEKEEHIGQIIQARKQESDSKRKRIYHLKSEEERIKKLQEEEEAHRREGTPSTSIEKRFGHFSSLGLSEE